ncbi:hypothetical protein SteCoe_14575 [Stentor coeruleus]|uniref:START domain-containing protein n=1 Tax=Stentor coeruleus TaxID=5963 RepID=A0A1R2C5U5_9CILI|nr:hypothetical protein SteCoe_14575 [Stentor coeruleus]
MGNANSFGVVRDKGFKQPTLTQEFAGSLSIEKYDILYQDFIAFESTEDPYSKSDANNKTSSEISFKNPIALRFLEIENYCKDIKFSKGWEIDNIIKIESIRGSIWSDYLPVVRVQKVFFADISYDDVIQNFLFPDLRKKWDPFRIHMKLTQNYDWYKIEYLFKYPIYNRHFHEVAKYKLENNELMIMSYSINNILEETPCNFFSCLKMVKKNQEITLVLISQIDYVIKESDKLVRLCGAVANLTLTAFSNYLSKV